MSKCIYCNKPVVKQCENKYCPNKKDEIDEIFDVASGLVLTSIASSLFSSDDSPSSPPMDSSSSSDLMSGGDFGGAGAGGDY